MRRVLFIGILQILTGGFLMAQNDQNNPGSNHANKFEQLGSILPTPNEYRTASGAPGPKYWQQRCDYDIKADLDEQALKIIGSETVTYYNNSPNTLTYLWLQLDENQHSSVNNANYQTSSSMPAQVTVQSLQRMEEDKTDNGNGVNITKLKDVLGKPLTYIINKTMMRVELPVPLKPGQKFAFMVDWNYKITDRMARGGRGGYEYFPEEDNYLFTITQWYPRLCVYSDFQGWQNHQFAGRGEFALTFGNFKVQMTVPADHVVGATGECQNYAQVLSPAQLARWKTAQTAKEPVEVVTLAEAKENEKDKAKTKKTWIFHANNVRDFAWTSSRKFVWDAMPAMVEGKKVMCMSFYGKEAYGLYRKYSTKAVAHTIKTYSKFTIPYPYPVAQSVEASNGMEYPMICFNYGRTEKDGTYSEATKYGMIGVIIHEVGHNFFPMIINSDERQWTWMDEGLNTFVEYLTEELWDNKFPSRRGPAWSITDYMKLPKDQLEPIMTNSENIANFGANAYAKPATGLNILRETIMGRELFDYAFKEYARRWAFKHPTPADLFRTMEDASAEDLDWFWRGWFYSTDAVDISLDSVKYARIDFSAQPPKDTMVLQNLAKPQVPAFDDISKIRNRNTDSIRFLTDVDTSLRDFYWRYARGYEPYDSSKYGVAMPSNLEKVDEATKQKYQNAHFYELTFSNKGGLVMPIIIEWTYKDGTKEVDRIPAQVWRYNENKVVKLFMKDKEVAAIKLDPMRETADINESNNSWGQVVPEPSRFQVFKQKQGAARGQSTGINPMQKAETKKGL
ncbi:M1 family metallopeptidase [Chitinophagaceae bacterium LB-8]|uniref:M1 family metallopeptidase n=1 Tax=Paraflavisolibacter caeni TaxID=2982496 RepID=A0A9X2XPC6_9BACT|nr:M1 family metallopeptidase [Paraflavisolibacter caeni]MCU7550544.1 M1 family metallopeptidase [Paraflavisolibacter caeni]